jgi:PiT family inorganic phosphate transporter
MFASPMAGFVLGLFIMGLLYALLRKWKPSQVNAVFGKAQLASAMSMGFMHGTNDAQKTMGIIALALAAATASGRLENLPSWLHFLYTEPPEPGQSLAIATWIKVTCALTMAAGTASGGWRIIKTLGHKMVRLQPVHGFAAETSSAAIIGFASHFGIPVSTTHVVSSAIMGVGAAKRPGALKWTVVEKMVWAWIFTLPVSATIAFWVMRLLQTAGFAS